MAPAEGVRLERPGYNLGHVTEDADRPKRKGSIPYPNLFDLLKFAFFSGLLLLAAWIAGTSRVAYTLIMLIVAGALAYAVLDLVDYEIVKRRRRA
jgi:hypothetical protein